jgi:hypothetical protein
MWPEFRALIDRVVELMRSCVVAAGVLSVGVHGLMANSNQSATWLAGESGNILFLSNASLSTTRILLTDVDYFRSAVEGFFGGTRHGESRPLKIVLCGNRATFRELAPDQSKFKNNIPGFFSRGLAYDVIVIQADAPGSANRQILFHELTHSILSTRFDLPLWLDEGYAESMSGFDRKKDFIRIGLNNRDHQQVIRRQGILPMDRLFAAMTDSEDYQNPKYFPRFYATAWAFVHAGLFGQPSFRTSFGAFKAEWLREGPLPESRLIHHFGKDYAQMQQYLRGYALSSRRNHQELAISALPAPRTFPLHPLDPKAVAAHLAGIDGILGKIESARHRMSQTGNSQPPAYLEKPLDDLASLVLFETMVLDFSDGDYESAHSLAHILYESGSRSPGILLIASHALLENHPRRSYRRADGLSLREINQILLHRDRILVGDPRNALAFRLSAVAWTMTDHPMPLKQAEVLLRGCLLNPANESLRKLVSEALVHHGHTHLLPRIPGWTAE